MIARSGRMPWRRLLTAALAAVAIFLYWTHVTERGQRDLVRSSAATDTIASIETRGWGASVGFADQRRLDEHFEKHGAEFGRITKQDYLRQAQLLRDAKVGGPVLEAVRRDPEGARLRACPCQAVFVRTTRSTSQLSTCSRASS